MDKRRKIVPAQPKRMSRDKIESYNRVELVQQLHDGLELREVYHSVRSHVWYVSYKSNSAYHLCDLSGSFKSCEGCEFHIADPDDVEQYLCMGKNNRVMTDELASRILRAEKADCKVEFFL